MVSKKKQRRSINQIQMKKYIPDIQLIPHPGGRAGIVICEVSRLEIAAPASTYLLTSHFPVFKPGGLHQLEFPVLNGLFLFLSTDFEGSKVQFWVINQGCPMQIDRIPARLR